jgi:hypothetical protein
MVTKLGLTSSDQLCVSLTGHMSHASDGLTGRTVVRTLDETHIAKSNACKLLSCFWLQHTCLAAEGCVYRQA